MTAYYAPAFNVKISGITLAANVTSAITELVYDSSLTTADMFTLKLNNADLSLTDSALFNVGENVEIYMGYAGNLQPMMLGEIAAVNPNFPKDGAPTITVSGYDKSQRLRHNTPEPFTFKFLNDSIIAAAIAAENLLIPVIDPCPTPPRESVPQTDSDWTFLRELARRNFFEVFVYWDRLYFRFPRPQTEMILLEWGRNLSSFSPRLSTAGQFGIQVLRGYDYSLAQTIVAILPAIAIGGDLSDIVERLGSSFINQLVSLGRYVVRDAKIENYVDALTVAKSTLIQLLEGLYEGSGSCIGMPEMRAGKYIQIGGVGKRFGGRYKLSKVTHTINDSGYWTRFEVSQNTNASILESLRKKLKTASSPSRDTQEKMTGVVVAKVVNNIDYKGLGRVQLTIPTMSDNDISAWARIATPMAGSGSGLYFLPDIGDEVLVAFDQGDAAKPIVLGGLWNGPAAPPARNTGLNEKKVIKLKTGMQIVFDETQGLSLDNGMGSSIQMDLHGDITIQAAGNVNIKSGAAGKVNLNP
jgi:phage protein D/phage baseplate assembly protein gpV